MFLDTNEYDCTSIHCVRRTLINIFLQAMHFACEPGHEKMCLMSYANNKGADQPAHPDAQSDQHLCCSLFR